MNHNEENMNGFNEIINFIEKISAKIYGLRDEREIYRTIAEEFKRSDRYAANILLLTEDERNLRFALTFYSSRWLKQGRKVITNLSRIAIDKSEILSEVVREGKSVCYKTRDFLKESALPKPFKLLVGFEETMSILTPLKQRGKIIGALMMSSPNFTESFVPYVKDLARHVSAALELAYEHHKYMERNKRLRESEEKYRDIFELAPDGIITVNLKGVVTSCNPAFSHLSGYSEEEIVGKHFFKLPTLHARDIPKYTKMFGSILRGETPEPFTIEWIHKDGAIRMMEVHPGLMKKDGKTIGVQAIIRDVTRCERMDDTFKKSLEKYRMIAENTNDLIALMTFTLNPTLTYVSPSHKKVLGFDSSELIGKPVFKDLHPEDKKKLLPLFKKYLKAKMQIMAGKIPDVYERFEVRLKDKSGKWRFFECTANIVGDEIVLISKDIDERKRAEESLKRSQEEIRKAYEELRTAHEQLRLLNESLEEKVKERTAEVERLLRQKDEFISQLGHDLKNPLNPLINLIPIVEKREQDPESKEMLQVVNRNVKYMKNLVIKTIQLAHLNTPTTVLSLEDMNLLDVIKLVIEKNKRLFDENQIDIRSKVNEEVFVKMNRLRLEELFDNLLVNAVKYSPGGGSVVIDAREDKDFVTVSVRDKGVGLTEEQIGHVFDEFYKVDQSRHDLESSGLGLSICKRIVEMHGGRIWAESPGLGKGTTMFFTLPKSNKTRGKSNK
jgi:PAS domain S-box-containing protein